jgi:alternate F1F0 ATPase F1 subunit epsilon
MFKTLDLKVYLPTEILLDVNIKKITFKGKSGYITILPNHLDYISSFDNNVMKYIDENNKERFIASNSGILIKYADKIKIITYKAIMGSTLEKLNQKILETSEEENELEKESNAISKQLEYFLLNNLASMK